MSNGNMNDNLIQTEAPPLTKKERRRLKREQKQTQATSPNGNSSGRANRWGWWVVIILVVAGMVYGLYRVATKPRLENGAGNQLSVPVSLADWQRGGESAAAVLVEYSDFQCPACAFYEPWIQQLSTEFGADLAVIYRQFPLSSHLNAHLASRASEAAGLQGKFWEMHDLLFGTQEDWGERLDAKAVFVTYAGELDLNTEQFEEDLNSREVRNLVDDDYQGGLDSGVKGTPSFFLNGRQIGSPRSYEDFVALIRAELTVEEDAELGAGGSTTGSSTPEVLDDNNQ